MAAAGEPDIVDTLKAGHTIGDKTYKVHIDGYNLLPYLTGQEDKSPRRGMIYSSDSCWQSEPRTGNSCSWSNAAPAP